MTENLTRVPAKIFAENAPQNVVGQFGSALNGTKVNTTDVSIIQGLPAYTTGWSSAVISNRNYPTLEEMNGVMKTMSYQTAYNMQKGVAEWDNQTTYYTGDICKAVGSGVLYVSRADNNIGNPVSNTTYWQEYQGAQTSIPATNYIYTMDGNATYNNLSVTLPDMTLYIADGRSGDNSVNNNVVNVTSDTYTVSGNGEYTLFYNNTTQDLHLAPEYTVRANDFPEGANYNDVCYKLDNRMYVVESINPNYSESAGVTVSDAGVVSGLGTLSLVFNGSIPLQPVLNLDFTTGADVTTTQDLFATPYAVGKISNGVFTTDLYSLAYSVDYYSQVYSGAYTLESQTVTYKYSINNTTYYTNSIIQVGSNLYTDEGLTTLYGTVTNLQNNTVTVSDIQTAYSGSFTQVSSGSYYTYDLGGTNYYTLVPIASGVVVYTDTATTDVFGTVTSVTGSTVLIQNTTQLYSGAYDDVTTSVYTYLLTSGPVYIYSAGVLIPGLTVYSDNTLTTAYGVVETITTSNVVIHSQNDSAGYVAQAGSGSVASGVSIYSDVNLQTLVATSTGANSTYTGSSAKSKVGTINYNVSASTQYSGSLEYNGTSYNLILNGVSSSFITSRNPYVDVQPAISFGGTNGFDGTIDISNMNMPNVWTWNGHNTTTPDWNVEPLCELGKITIENGAISDLKINYPIELVKFSDLEHLNLPQGGGGSGYQMFDIVMKDHVLSYEETLGLAPLGTYVYKEAIAGTRYGYPSFYQKCVDEYNNVNNTVIAENWTQPILTANGTMGGSSFAVVASAEVQAGSNPSHHAWEAFDNNSNTYWRAGATTGWIEFYNPIPLNVTNIEWCVYYNYPTGGNVEGSNDGSTWTELTTWTNSSLADFNIDLSANTNSYKYYRVNVTGVNQEGIHCAQINITATYTIAKEADNKHKFYDIADKATFDNMYAITGEAWYYGVDTTNERIFLPRSQYITGYVANGNYNAHGTETSLGMSDTYRDYGLYVIQYGSSSYTALAADTNAAGQPIGTQAGMGTLPGAGYILGLNPDATKSGITTNIINTESTRIPYMVVGNQSTWSGMTDVVNQGMTILSQVNAGLATKLDLDLTNITNSTKSTIAGYAMPSSTYKTYTLGASGMTITAPANGFFRFGGVSGGLSGYYIKNRSTTLVDSDVTAANGYVFDLTVECRKNDIIEILYQIVPYDVDLRFVYAQGSESEAS